MAYAQHDAGTENTLVLPDGRALAYAEYGGADGEPVLAFHGMPGSRLSWGMLPDNPIPTGVRLIAPDRPGYGGSSPHVEGGLLGWADDMARLADALSLDRFSVVGISGGGPGALACAWKMAGRVRLTGVVSGAAPSDAPGAFEGMSATNRFFMRLAWRFPRLSALNLRLLARVIRRDPAGYIDTMRYKLDEVDRAILARPEIHRMLVRDFAEAVRLGPYGMIGDMAANHGRPWGFELNEIQSPVHFWFCERDRSVPVAMGRYLAGSIPGCTANLVHNAGHLWILEHLREVLEAMVGTGRTR